MYGMINNAMRTLVVTKTSEASWSRIVERAGIEHSVFGSMIAYDDAITYKLVDAASVELAVSAEALLFEFGRHWVLVTAPEQYGAMLGLMGSTIDEFFGNLGRMHDRIATLFDNLKQPSFEVEKLSAKQIRLHYRSERRGLAPFLRGLLDGIGERFQTAVLVEHEAVKDRGADHDIFLVEFGIS